MYVENPPGDNNMEQEVNEATAALKGMLGLGGDGAAVAAATPVAGTAKKKKKNKKKKGETVAAATPGTNSSNNNDNKGSHNTTTTANNNKPPPGNSTNKRKNKKKNKKDDEFHAWSAFQSSPDASKLPMPSFSPAAESSTTEAPATPLKSDVVVTASVDHTTTPTATTQEQPTQSQEETNEPLPSETGVNLAALALSPPSVTPTPATTPNLAPAQAHLLPPPQQHPQHLPPPYGAAPPPPPFNQPPPPPLPPFGSPYGTPPGYVTIQVRVPPTIHATNRQMVVNAPGGYPVQVAVPPGIPPGAVIPVHVPAPLHMMPPGYHHHPPR